MTFARTFTIIGILVVLGFVNAAILGKERIIHGGETIYVELGPRDPRSMMQGDYMALRLPLADRIRGTWVTLPAEARPREGQHAIARIRLDERRVATLAEAGDANTLPLRYRVRAGAAWIGTNAFFFEEGKDGIYAPARFGEFRIDRETGEAVLTGLRDAQLVNLEPNKGGKP